MSFLEPMDWTFLAPITNVALMAQNGGLPCTPNAECRMPRICRS
jgi:hypothetical protein